MIGSEPYEMVQNNQLLSTKKEWGPSYVISFDIFINSWPEEKFKKVLHFTTGQECCKIGDRIPLIMIKNKNLYVKTNIGNHGNSYNVVNGLSAKKWMNIWIAHYFKDGAYQFKIEVDEETKIQIPNPLPVKFDDVKIYTGTGSLSCGIADVKIRNLYAINTK